MSKTKEIQEFWEERGKLEDIGGTNDFLAQEIEEQALVNHVPEKARVLDIGCGDGHALHVLNKEKNCSGLGIDYSQSFIEQCHQNYSNDQLSFKQFDIRELGQKSEEFSAFDLFFSKRCLINLDSEAEQKEIFGKIIETLPSDKQYIMIECFEEGNNALNEIRRSFDLPEMKAPWHNTYLKLEHVRKWEHDFDVTLEAVDHFSSTYYFLSRIINAKLAKDNNEEPRYDAKVNLLAKDLPAFGEFGAPKLIVWKKN